MERNKVVLIKTDSEKGKKYVPYSLLYIGGVLKRLGMDVEIIHCAEKETKAVIEKVKQMHPLFFGFSVVTGAHIKDAVEISQAIKESNKDSLVIWGGIHPSIMPEQCLREDYIDMVVVGEGEDTIEELVPLLKEGKTPEGVLGVGYKTNAGLKINDKRPFIKDLSKCRVDFSLLDLTSYLSEYQGKKRRLQYIASRGCPFPCGFCYNIEFNNQKWRPIPLDIVCEDITYLKETYKIDSLEFMDDNFFVDKERSLKILEHLDTTCFAEIRMDSVTDSYIAKLKKLKVQSMLVGVESGSERSQKFIRKLYGVETIKKAIHIFSKHDIKVFYSIVIGFPQDTDEDVNDTIDMCIYINKHHKKSTFKPGVYLPFPGSPLYDYAVKQGFNEPKDTLGWSKVDRWRGKVEMGWLDPEKYYYIKWYCYFLALKFKPIQAICEWRLKKRNFKFPYDLKIMLYLYENIFLKKSKIRQKFKGIINKYQNHA